MSTKKTALRTGCGVLANMLKHVVLSPLLADINAVLVTVNFSWPDASTSTHMFTQGGNLHSWELQRRGAPSEEHSVYKHPVFTETPQVEISAAGAVVAGGEYLQMPPRNEAGVAHAHVHRALRRVPADSHRALFHHVFEFTALEPGNWPRRSAHHGHVRVSLNARCWDKSNTGIMTPSRGRSEAYKYNKSTRGASNSKQDFRGEHARPGTAAPTHRWEKG